MPANAGAVLKALLYRLVLPRGDVGDVLDATDRHGRRIIRLYSTQRTCCPLSVAHEPMVATPLQIGEDWASSCGAGLSAMPKPRGRVFALRASNPDAERVAAK